MRTLLVSISAIVLILSLASCAHMSREDVGLVGGGVVGGVVGHQVTGGSAVGTVAGTLGGAFVGRELAR